KQGNITLKRGLTKEPALLAWLQKSVVKAELTNMSLTLYDSAGKKVQAWSFAGAYPVKWTASDPNAGGNEIMTESLEIAHSGIQTAWSPPPAPPAPTGPPRPLPPRASSRPSCRSTRARR